MRKLERRVSNQGFTLIELVLVIVILGILAIATSKFIVFGTQIYLQATDRQHVLSKSRFVVERLTRELRASVPNSVRISPDRACINFVPIKASGAYRDDANAIQPPFSPKSGTEIDIVSWSGSYALNDRFYVFPQTSRDIYLSDTQWASISTATPNPASPNYRITFTRSNTFPFSSPNKRFYTARTSVYYCLANNSIYRYEQPSISGFFFPASIVMAIGDLMAEGLTNDLALEPPFNYRPGALYRNSVVNLYFEFSANQSENMFFNQEVHIPNVP